MAKEKRQQQTNLENQLKILEKSLDNDLSNYNAIKNELDVIYDHIIEGIRIRSKCNWYQHGEKSTKLFLNLEEHNFLILTLEKYGFGKNFI